MLAIDVPNARLYKSINYDASKNRPRKLLHIQWMESGDKFPLEAAGFERNAVDKSSLRDMHRGLTKSWLNIMAPDHGPRLRRHAIPGEACAAG
jgi:hypothetical protein